MRCGANSAKKVEQAHDIAANLNTWENSPGAAAANKVKAASIPRQFLVLVPFAIVGVAPLSAL
jgi:hypothetical protein